MKIKKLKISLPTHLKLSVLGLLIVAIFAVFGLANSANAAALTWSANETVDLSDPDVNLTIASGSAATSLVVGTGSIAVVVPNGSVFTVTSASRDLGVTGDSSSEVTNTCNSGTATVEVYGGAVADTVTITPTATQCDEGSSEGGGGGGGGGGGSTPPPVVPPVAPGCSAGNLFNASTGLPCTSANAPVSCSPGQMFNGVTGERCTSVNLVFCPPGQMFNGVTGERCNTVISSEAPGASGYAFGNGVVKLGSKGEACKAWQQFFNDKAGAHLTVDGWCGKLTIAVAKAWQASVGLVADGLLGALSRAKALLQ